MNVTITQLCCVAQKHHRQYINEWTWLCSNKAFYIATKILNFTFTCVRKYSSFDFFQLFKNVKAIHIKLYKPGSRSSFVVSWSRSPSSLPWTGQVTSYLVWIPCLQSCFSLQPIFHTIDPRVFLKHQPNLLEEMDYICFIHPGICRAYIIAWYLLEMKRLYLWNSTSLPWLKIFSQQEKKKMYNCNRSSCYYSQLTWFSL